MKNPLEDNEIQRKKPAVTVEEKPVQSEKTESPAQTERQNIVIHSELDAMVMDRLKSQPKTLKEVDEEVIVQGEQTKHRLSLPDELLPYTKKYAFCWIFKRKQAIDEAMDQMYYKMTNRLYFPDLPDHCFSARGVIERGDNILMFRPKRVDEEMRRAPGVESNERIKARMKAHEGDPNYYIPKPEDGEKSVVGV
jgi:hypothetical protein